MTTPASPIERTTASPNVRQHGQFPSTMNTDTTATAAVAPSQNLGGTQQAVEPPARSYPNATLGSHPESAGALPPWLGLRVGGYLPLAEAGLGLLG